MSTKKNHQAIYPPSDEESIYKIVLKESIDPKWSEWFYGFAITKAKKGAILRGTIRDQSELHGLLNKIRDMNLTIISVTKTSGRRSNEGQSKNHSRGI